MPPIDRTPCPHCGRPMAFEYRLYEETVCQLWRVMSEGGELDPRTLSDCFGRTSRRIRELEAKIVELTVEGKAARKALARHHAAQHPATFRNGARIE